MKKLVILLSLTIALLLTACTSYFITTFESAPCEMRGDGFTLCVSVPNASWQFVGIEPTPTAETDATIVPVTATPEFCTDPNYIARTTNNLNMRNWYSTTTGAIILTIPRNALIEVDRCVTKALPSDWLYVHFTGTDTKGVARSNISGFVVAQYVVADAG